MAAGAATIFRNYLVPIAGKLGQSSDRQLDGLADLQLAFAHRLFACPETLWTMRNGYALATRHGLAIIAADLHASDPGTLNELRGLLRVGLHSDVEVTDGPPPNPLVSQVFCSALPVLYSDLPASLWAPFARFVLEAAYEATLLASALNAARGISNRVLLTRLGGGVFGNDDSWIDAAMLRAFHVARDFDIDAAIVSFGKPPTHLKDFVTRSGFA